MGTEFDEQLKQRLIAFQTKQGLTADGVADAQTWQALVSGAHGQDAAQESEGSSANAAAGALLVSQVPLSGSPGPVTTPPADPQLPPEAFEWPKIPGEGFGEGIQGEIVVGGHYDTWFAGSTDNGGGITGVIALAERRALRKRPAPREAAAFDPRSFRRSAGLSAQPSECPLRWTPTRRSQRRRRRRIRPHRIQSVCLTRPRSRAPGSMSRRAPSLWPSRRRLSGPCPARQ